MTKLIDSAQRNIEIILFLLRIMLAVALLVIGSADIDMTIPSIDIFPATMKTIGQPYIMYAGIMWAALAGIEIAIITKIITPRFIAFYSGIRITNIFIYRCVLAGIMPIYILTKFFILCCPINPLDILALACFPLLLTIIAVAENYEG